MKKVFFIVVFAILGVLQSEAQVSFKPGIKAGLNFSKLQDTNLENKTDFYIGGFGTIKFSNVYSLQPELIYSRQGGKGTVSGFYYDQVSPTEINTVYEERDADVSLQYLSFVTMNKFNINKSFYILAGPYFDFLVGDDFKIDRKNEYRAEISKGEDIDLGLTGGIGYIFPNGIGFEARIKKGTRDAIDDRNGSATVNINFGYQIGATYTFDLK